MSELPTDFRDAYGLLAGLLTDTDDDDERAGEIARAALRLIAEIVRDGYRPEHLDKIRAWNMELLRHDRTT